MHSRFVMFITSCLVLVTSEFPYFCVSVTSALAGVNLALGKPTNQSSTMNMHSSRYAVDGMFNTNAGLSPWCTNTNDPAGGSNWWMFDLQQIILVGHVVLTNRADCCGKKNRMPFYDTIH